MRSARPLLLAVVVSVAAACAGCASSEERRTREDAIAIARAEIAQGRACIWEIGKLPPNAAADPETGLPRISFTCEVNDATFAAQEAHNDEVRSAWRAGKLGGRRR